MSTAVGKFKLLMHLRSPNLYIVYMQCPNNTRHNANTRNLPYVFLFLSNS